MNLKRDVLMAKVNLYISSAFILSFGIFVLTIGFKLTHLPNPVEHVLSPGSAAIILDDDVFFTD